MKVDVEYKPSYSVAVVSLERGEALLAESGAMVSMSSSIRIDTKMRGGLFGSLKRRLLGGESFFINTFTAEGGPGEVLLAPALPGDIMTAEISGTMYFQSGSFLGGSPTLEIDTKWGGARTFFASEGLFLLKIHGAGTVIAASYGAIHKVHLDGGSYVCDTGHIVAFTDSLAFDVRPVGGLKSTLLSGEGLVCEFHGTGDLYLQTRSTQAFLAWLLPHLRFRGRSAGRGGGGFWSALGGG